MIAYLKNSTLKDSLTLSIKKTLTHSIKRRGDSLLEKFDTERLPHTLDKKDSFTLSRKKRDEAYLKNLTLKDFLTFSIKKTPFYTLNKKGGRGGADSLPEKFDIKILPHTLNKKRFPHTLNKKGGVIAYPKGSLLVFTTLKSNITYKPT